MTNLLRHLGHTYNVHLEHYRQTSDVVERLDVAKVLLIQDSGLVSENRKKKLQDIELKDISFRGKFHFLYIVHTIFL